MSAPSDATATPAPPTVDAAKAALSEWVQARARSDDDARAASKLIAAFVAAAVRQDRSKVRIAERTADMLEQFREIVRRAGPPTSEAS
jgi:hypothetical protein